MLRLSASNIQSFKDCPMQFYLSNVLGLQPIEEKDSFRIGHVWHKLCEIVDMEPGSPCPKNPFEQDEKKDGSDCYWCGGTGKLPNDIWEVVTRYLDKVYAQVPPYKTHDEWVLERTILLYSLIGYKWYYTNQKYSRWASEIKLEKQINNTTTLVGRIDEIVTEDETGEHYIRERKSTSSEIDGSSDYWDRIGMDNQISGYLHLCRNREDLPVIKNILYDVWHKPKIKQKFLTQKASKEFVETGEYCGQKFVVRTEDERYIINNEFAIWEPGKKAGTYAIYETPEMFGARLLEDITTRPEYYFQQREIGRTDSQMKKFEDELSKISQVIRGFKAKDLWYCNDKSCKNRYKCDFTSICQNNIEVDVNNPPDGFKIYRGKENE